MPVYEAIERWYKPQNPLGSTPTGSIRMLGRGVSLEGILEMIADRMGDSQTEVESGPNGERAA